MKNGQCPKCGSPEVFCNTNRKFPALHTIPLGPGSVGNRYAPLDIYVCVSCGYIESYMAKPSDLSYVKEEWAAVGEECDRASTSVSEATPEEIHSNNNLGTSKK
jgi:predicted nucleic-acid-binding Zn-ribbon protein